MEPSAGAEHRPDHCGAASVHDVQRPPIRPGRYVAPATIDEALAIAAEHRERARVVAGGTDLLVEFDRRVGGDVDVLVDLTRVVGLDAIVVDGDQLVLGPLVTHNQCATDARIVDHALALAQASAEVGSPALRNRATIVGNVVTASPANDTISALVALDAELTLASVDGTRTVAAAAFHTGVRASVLEPHELVTEVRIPIVAGRRSLFVKLGLRRAQAISVVHVALAVHESDDAITECRVAMGSVAPTIVRSYEAEAAIVAGGLTADAIGAAAGFAAGAVSPIDDLRADAAYRSGQVEVMVRRGLGALASGAERDAWPADPPCLGGPSVPADGSSVALGPGDMITATVNGAEVSAPWTATTLLDWLRDDAELTGTKEGCAEGECGACTVHLDGVATLSCLIPAGRAHGARLGTIEGLADASLHPLQQAFVDCAAAQCGYCIPGFLMAGAALIDERPQPTETDVRIGLSGNICRCTGYAAIEAAFVPAERREPRSVTVPEGSAR
jgi:xanthine dehydrogenase iron-sulfur cluster and FAD-binding subunit A